MPDILEPTADSAWVLGAHGYDPLRERDIESRFSISNGFLGVRGARGISRGPMWVSWMPAFNWASWPRTYVAGLFETPNVEPPVPALVPAGDWSRVQIRLNGEPLLLRSGRMLSHRRTLDMRRGLLIVDWHQQHPSGGVRIRTLRLVSQAERTIGLQLLRLEIDRQVEITLEAEIIEAGLGLEAVRLEQDLGVWRTEQSGKGLAMGSAVRLQLDGRDKEPTALDPFKWSWRWTSSPGQAVSLQRFVTILRSDDRDADPGAAARQVLDGASKRGWCSVLTAHEDAWAGRWRASDVVVEGDDAAQQALRFALYHLNGAANPDDERVSIGARALTGDSYFGHVFWDTEIYLLPFYTLTWPEAARALLMYRYHTLCGARAKAARMGWRGAMYAWESADTGDETTPDHIMSRDGKPVAVLCGEQEQHITADVAYAIWHYWQSTHDMNFLCEAGAEILLETARFWASRGQLGADGRRHIRGVIGPDEYHENIDDNAFTNVMARWNIQRALEIAALLRKASPGVWTKLVERLALDDAELEQWLEVAETLVTGYQPESGMIEQFSGFFGLEDIDVAHYAKRTGSIEAVLGRERIQGSKVTKQADVVALLALLPGEFDAPTTLRNFRYYDPRCAHDSSLSRPMHALVAARLGDSNLALRYFREAGACDLADTGDGNGGGVHIATLGGLWQVAVLGFAGLSSRDDALCFAPQLPDDWQCLGFRLQWRGRRLNVRIEQTGHIFHAMQEAGEPMTVVVNGEPHELGVHRAIRTSIRSGLARPLS